jgi:hypothetical protein
VDEEMHCDEMIEGSEHAAACSFQKGRNVWNERFLRDRYLDLGLCLAA